MKKDEALAGVAGCCWFVEFDWWFPDGRGGLTKWVVPWEVPLFGTPLPGPTIITVWEDKFEDAVPYGTDITNWVFPVLDGGGGGGGGGGGSGGGGGGGGGVGGSSSSSSSTLWWLWQLMMKKRMEKHD